MILRDSGIAYALFPFKRNQDVVQIHEFEHGDYCIAIADGWNRLDAFPDDKPGREVAHIVASEYPKMFLTYGKDASKKLDERIAKKYPMHATAVAVFLFHSRIGDTVVSIGDVETYVWDENKWYKPREISDHWLDSSKYPSNVSRFFGSIERKTDPKYPGVFSVDPDILELQSATPIIIATDGIKDVLPLDNINTIVGNPRGQEPEKIVEKLLKEIQKRKTQKDDISIALRYTGDR